MRRGRTDGPIGCSMSYRRCCRRPAWSPCAWCCPHPAGTRGHRRFAPGIDLIAADGPVVITPHGYALVRSGRAGHRRGRAAVVPTPSRRGRRGGRCAGPLAAVGARAGRRHSPSEHSRDLRLRRVPAGLALAQAGPGSLARLGRSAGLARPGATHHRHRRHAAARGDPSPPGGVAVGAGAPRRGRDPLALAARRCGRVRVRAGGTGRPSRRRPDRAGRGHQRLRVRRDVPRTVGRGALAAVWPRRKREHAGIAVSGAGLGGRARRGRPGRTASRRTGRGRRGRAVRLPARARRSAASARRRAASCPIRPG